MKVFVLTLALLATSAFSAPAENQNVDIDWTTVKPIEHYPKFWDDKPASIRPPASFFEKLEKTQRSGRIVGGQIATQHQFPYQAAVLMFLPAIGGNALCGGSIISNRIILTAAHCVEGATSGTIVLGAHFITNANEPNQRRIAVGAAAILLHPLWDPSLIRNDIALVQLPAPVELNAFIRPAVLPTGITNQFAGALGVVSGWGVFSDAEGRSSDVLRYVYDDIMTNTLCTVRFPGVIQASNICVTGTNGRGACSGDSGGPLTVQINGESVQTGVVSFGLALGCELAWPSVFARVSFFYDWINSNMGGW